MGESTIRTALITGAGSGLGLELASRYLENGYVVFACLKSENSKVRALGREWDSKLHIIKLDLRSRQSISSLGKKVLKHTRRIDILVNNAGIMHKDEKIKNLDWKKMCETLTVNSIAPLFVVKALLELIKSSENPKIINISSLSGSISRVSGFSNIYGYKAGKASLNMMTRILAYELKNDKIPVVAVHPGTMKTKMGPENAQMSAEKASRIIASLIESVKISHTGKFLNFDGAELQW